MNNNLTLWASVEHTDPKFTKQFKRGGGFTGTAINPTWLHKRATETFGPVGRGWGWTIVEERQVASPAGETVMWFSKVRVWYLLDGLRYETPEQWGGTEMCGKNKYGAFMDEEAPKKTITDAVGKCLSYLGFAADVFMGLYDDSKYVAEVRHQFQSGDAAKEPVATNGNGQYITEKQVMELETLADEVKADRAGFLGWLKVESFATIPVSQYPMALAGLKKKAAK